MIGLRYSMYEVVRLTHMYQSALNSPRRRARFRYPSEDIMMIPEGNIHHLNESISFGGPGHLPNPPKFHKPPGSDPKECLHSTSLKDRPSPGYIRTCDSYPYILVSSSSLIMITL